MTVCVVCHKISKSFRDERRYFYNVIQTPLYLSDELQQIIDKIVIYKYGEILNFLNTTKF